MAKLDEQSNTVVPIYTLGNNSDVPGIRTNTQTPISVANPSSTSDIEGSKHPWMWVVLATTIVVALVRLFIGGPYSENRPEWQVQLMRDTWIPSVIGLLLGVELAVLFVASIYWDSTGHASTRGWLWTKISLAYRAIVGGITFLLVTCGVTWGYFAWAGMDHGKYMFNGMLPFGFARFPLDQTQNTVMGMIVILAFVLWVIRGCYVSSR